MWPVRSPGVPLHVEVRGSGPPLVLLHGFTQTGRLWGPFGSHLATTHTLLAVDLPGHAGSDSVRSDLVETASLVADAVGESRRCAGVPDGPVDLLGYSLGARIALHVFLHAALPVRRAVLIGVTAGIEDPAARERRRRDDEALADELEASGDVAAFMERWLNSPLFTRLQAAHRADRLRNSAAGLASSLRLCGTGTQEPVWDLLETLECPLLVLAGADDTRFASHALRVASAAPRAVATLVPGGGHAVHLAQPGLAARLVDHWLGSSTPAVTPSGLVS
jgi:2-succinyl-6-hydroxy-2,4-cyclohexadiene-1-carboxylate synthase